MQIHGNHHVQGSHGLQGPHFAKRSAEAGPARHSQPVDQLDISSAAQAASEADAVHGDIRTDLVARLKAEIASGSYETAEKVDVAVDRLLDAIG